MIWVELFQIPSADIWRKVDSPYAGHVWNQTIFPMKQMTLDANVWVIHTLHLFSAGVNQFMYVSYHNLIRGAIMPLGGKDNIIETILSKVMLILGMLSHCIVKYSR